MVANLPTKWAGNSCTNIFKNRRIMKVKEHRIGFAMD